MTALSPISASIPRVALVTGAAQRLGRSTAVALAEAGFDVAVHCHRSIAAAEELAVVLRGMGRRATVLKADLASEAEVQRLIFLAAEVLGPLGVLINNASMFERDEWDDASRASWDAHIEPNLRAPFVLMQNFARGLPQKAEGAIVNLLDQRVWSLTPHFISYTVSKFGLWGLTQAMALALAPRIRVNGIGPGPTLPNSRQTTEQFRRQFESVPLGHGPSPDEVARAVIAILCLPSLTGQMLALDGGQHLQWKSGRLRTAEEE